MELRSAIGQVAVLVGAVVWGCGLHGVPSATSGPGGGSSWTSLGSPEAKAAGARSRPGPPGRTIRFAGHDWRVKASGNRVGPGPNYFSDDGRNVEVNSQGRLHLRIVQENGRWTCAEIISVESFGHGTYRFDLAELPEDLDPRVVLGMFTWSDAPEYSHREIDVEVSRWGNPENDNAQFVVQPYTVARNIVRFTIPKDAKSTTHAFAWSSDRVTCESAEVQGSPESRRVIKAHTFTQGIPRPGDENARINLWLMSGRAPADGEPVEVVFTGFEFSKQ